MKTRIVLAIVLAAMIQLPAGAATVSPANGPLSGGNAVLVTNAVPDIGDGTDITNVTVGGVSAAILGQGATWVAFTAPATGSAGAKDIVIQSASKGDRTLSVAYTVNPAGQIGGTTYGPSAWTNLGSGVPGDPVYALAHDGTNLYAGGQFTSAGGVAAKNIAMWNGSSWTNLGSGMNAIVYDLVHDGTNLYAGGDFTNAGGVAARRVAKWDGASWTNLGSGMNAIVYDLMHDGTNLYAGGSFTNAGGVAANRVAKWDGASWTNLGSGISSQVRALAHVGTSLYAGGQFTSAGGVAANRVAKWDGASWTNLGSGMNDEVFALAHDGMDLYAGGIFSEAGGVTVNGVAMWDGASWTNLGSGLDMWDITLLHDGVNLYVGGLFTTAGGMDAYCIAKWGPSIVATLGVEPSSGSYTGGYPVAISGSHLGDGTDVTDVTLCGVSASSIVSQSPTQVVIVAGAAGGAVTGDVRVFSTSFGETVKSNAFEYIGLVPQLELSSTNANVREAGEGRFFAKLDIAPAANTTVTVAQVSGDADITVQGGAALVFTPANWSTWQVVTLAAANDVDTANGTATIRVTAPSATPVDVTASELDDDIGSNIALSSGGSTASGGGYGTRTIDGIHLSSTNYGYTVWTNVPPDAMTLDLKATATVTRVRLLNWDWTCIYQRYQIESSLDGTTWSNLADASAADRAGWDDWDAGSVNARYLRLTGLTNTGSKGVIVSEWEVYGTRPPAPVVSRTAVNVRENGEGRFFVRFSSQPAANRTVTVARVSGDTDLTVSEGAALIFTPANWSAWQRVTLAAADDPDTDNGTATFRVATPGAGSSPDVAATELDDDIGTNLALSSGGSTIAGGSFRSRTIDGTHTSYANFGYTVLTNMPAQTMTLDLKGAATLSRLRLLNWDWTARFQRYQVESSMDGSTWSNLVDASTGQHTGWEDAALDGRQARYLRLTGQYSSDGSVFAVAEWEVYGARVPGPVVNRSTVNVRENGEGRFLVKLDAAPAANTTVTVARVSGDADVSVTEGAALVFTPANWSAWWRVTLAGADDVDSDNDTATIRVTAPGAAPVDVTATELDDDIGMNLALASGGSTAAGGSYPGRAIDGIHTSITNYAYQALAQAITLDLKSTATVARVRLLNWDWTARYQRYQIEASVDGATWTNVVDASTGNRAGWEDWAIADEPARYLRLTGLYASDNYVFALVEWEVYAAGGGGGGGVRKKADDRSAQAGAAALGIATVVTGDDGPEHTNGWPAVDGNLETYWEGRAGSDGWYISVGFDAMRTLTNLDLYLAADSLTNVLYLYSLDSETWRDLVPALTASPVELKYLWLVFPADGTPATPKVIEITPQP